MPKITTRPKALPVVTDDPEIIAAYEQAKTDYRESQNDIITAAHALGAEGIAQYTTFRGGMSVSGLLPKRGSEIPAGWFLRQKDQLWRPIRKTSKTGPEVDAAHQWLADHQPAPHPIAALRDFGLDPLVRTSYNADGGCRIGSAAVRQVPGKLMVDPRFDHWDGAEPDPTHWRALKRSEYEAILEQAEEANAREADGASA